MLMAAMALAAAPEPRLSQVHGAIFDDMQTNAIIGNGNDLVSWPWYFGHDHGHRPELRISEVRCGVRPGGRSCSFLVTRTADPRSARPAEDAGEHRRLRCSASLARMRQEDRRYVWQVIHAPPSNPGGHSRTSMRCRVPLPAEPLEGSEALRR